MMMTMTMVRMKPMMRMTPMMTMIVVLIIILIHAIQTLFKFTLVPVLCNYCHYDSFLSVFPPK